MSFQLDTDVKVETCVKCFDYDLNSVVLTEAQRLKLNLETLITEVDGENDRHNMCLSG